MNALNDLTRNADIGTNGRYIVRSQAKEAALLASTQVWEGGFTIVVDYGNTKYVKITDGEKTFTDIAKTGEGGGGDSVSANNVTETATRVFVTPAQKATLLEVITKATGSPVDIQYIWGGTQAEYDADPPPADVISIITNAPEQYAAIAAASGTGTAVVFTEDKVYGTVASPVTGNITASATGAKLGVTIMLIHNSGTEPTFDAKFAKLSGSGDYVISVLNYISCQYINSTKILYSINQEA